MIKRSYDDKTFDDKTRLRTSPPPPPPPPPCPGGVCRRPAHTPHWRRRRGGHRRDQRRQGVPCRLQACRRAAPGQDTGPSRAAALLHDAAALLHMDASASSATASASLSASESSSEAASEPSPTAASESWHAGLLPLHVGGRPIPLPWARNRLAMQPALMRRGPQAFASWAAGRYVLGCRQPAEGHWRAAARISPRVDSDLRCERSMSSHGEILNSGFRS
jgi:hypothetical protein